ncbi:hypothetical protein [Acetobacter cerevisiae]|uniref:hypothetical protein n=1 Tax=Acetobacter cerevisiae TaxID=178900 RepID=UPI00209E9D50|nr:hypothetical protein [Acetobacter cerevisiae]MCP1270205.1 hypothetical protein [Acetobacter cerevisiae]MCP1278159.1 hypothetical protein [Acetobacter cerevisiae]
MTTPANWPNPERPGYPMFPERDGWHNFVGHHVTCAEEDDTDSLELSPIYLYCCWWDSEGQAWSGFDEAPWDLEECADSLADMEYHSPAITPTQLTELLAGERERCVVKAVDEQWNFPSDPSIQTPEAAVAFRACQRIIDAIRNLGDAP